MPVVRRTCDPPLGHAWFEVPGDWSPPYGGDPYTFRCERCGREKHEAYGRNTGNLEYRRYIDPPGWVRYGKDEPKPTTEEKRLAWIEQHILDARKTRKRTANERNSAAS
jgi:hypothetical protein